MAQEQKIPIIYIMRHGKPTYQDTEKLHLQGMGAELAQLTPEGIADVEEATKDPRIQDIDLIVSSPYPRALQTAAIISRRLDKPIDIAVGLFEWMPAGPNITLTHNDAHERWKEYLKNQGIHQEGDKYPDWETHIHLRQRTKEAITPFLSRENVKKLLVVSHGAVMRSLMNQPSLPTIKYCEILELRPEMLED